jgi:dihydrodipicolinate synthase/N-acetylneuraminate lyase
MEPHALRGSIPALVTPLSKGEIDIDSVGRLVEHVLGQGASGVVALGLSGELSVIPPKLRAPLIRAVISVVAGRVPVLVASGRPSLSETEAEIQEAIALGATAVLVAPSPCFGLNPQEVHRLFRHLSRLFPLPLFYYHLPSVTRAQVTPKTIHALRRDGLIAGIKDSSGNAAFLARILSLSADDETFRVFLGGSHYLLAGASMGVHGVISTIGNVASHLERRVLEARDSTTTRIAAGPSGARGTSG